MAEAERKTLVIDEGGKGDYRTLTEAVAACAAAPEEPVRFFSSGTASTRNAPSSSWPTTSSRASTATPP